MPRINWAVVAQCGSAASDQRSAFSAQLGLVAQAFLPVWFLDSLGPKPHRQECVCHNTALAIVCGLLACAGCSKKEEAQAEAPAPVRVTAVTQDTVRRVVTGDGVLYARDQTPVTPKIQAPVQKFYVNRGDHVKEGQLLAILENRDLVAAAAEAKSAVDQAESNLRSIQGATVPEAAVKAQTDLDAARQALEAAKKVLDSRQDVFKQ